MTAEAGAFPRCLDDDDARWSACIADAEGSDVLAQDIHTAASLGDEEVVVNALHSDPLLALARNDLGWSPLMYAVWQGHEPLVVALLEASRRSGHDATAGVVGRLPRSGRTLLMVAARFGHLRVATRLCQPKSLEMRDFRGQTALFHAVRGRNEDIIRMVVSQGANVNAWWVLRGVVVYLPDFLSLLVNDTKSREFRYFYDALSDYQGQTVLRLAERCSPLATCSLLRKAGARLEATVAVPRPAATAAPAADASLPLHLSLTLSGVLEGLSLQKYLALFQLHRIELQDFLAMSEDDLRSVGVSLLGPRRKMAMEIDRLQSLLGMN